jgi:hypothetical protein
VEKKDHAKIITLRALSKQKNNTKIEWAGNEVS